MSKDMCSGNRPNFNSGNRLIPNGGRPRGTPPGSALERNALGSPRASRPALRGFFAPGRPASAATAPGGSGGPAADVAVPPGCPSCAAGVAAVKIAAAAAAAATGDVETEASSRPGTAAAGPDAEPDAQPARKSHRRVDRHGEVLFGVDRGRSSTPASGGLVAGW